MLVKTWASVVILETYPFSISIISIDLRINVAV